MLHDLSFLNKGQIFPPRGEIVRLQKYKDNALLFEDEEQTVWKQCFKDGITRITRVVNDYKDMIAYPVDINYHKLTSVKTMDFVCGEAPAITAENKDIENIVEITKLNNKLSEWVIDISRFGDAIARIYKDKDLDGKEHGQVAVCQPNIAYKIVSREDKEKIINWVLAEIIELPESTEQNKKYAIKVQVHYVGYYDEYLIKAEPLPSQSITLENKLITNLALYKIGDIIPDSHKEGNKTGLKDFAIVSLHQLMTSDSCWGHDDYSSIDSILAEIWARFGQIAVILDKHSRPDAYGPESAFDYDENGNRTMKTGGNTWIVGQNEITPGYMTWDGQLAACFNEINLLFEQLYQISEMGAVYKAAANNNNIAYETMRATFSSVLAKAARITKSITDPIKKIIELVSQLGGVDVVEAKEITIEWFDGLPNDEKQEIEKATSKINAGLSTPKRENINRFGLTEEQADIIAEDVRTDRADKQVAMFGNMPEL